MKLQNNFAASSPPHPNQPSPLNSFFFNADEIGLFWQSLPNSSLAEASESSAWGLKKKNESLTAIICANILGFNKIKPLMMEKFCSSGVFTGVTLSILFMDCKLIKGHNNSLYNFVTFISWSQTPESGPK